MHGILFNNGHFCRWISRLKRLRLEGAEAEAAGVKPVPALVMNWQTYHINFGASISDLK